MLKPMPLEDRAVIGPSLQTKRASGEDAISGQARGASRVNVVALAGVIRGLGFVCSLFVACQTGLSFDWQRDAGYQFAELNIPMNDSSVGRRVGFVEMPPNHTGLTFSNALSAKRILENNNYMNGSGVAAGDFDGDGLCDLYFCSIAGTNALYRNLGGWRFEEVTATAGVGLASKHSTGAGFADLDGDGDLDLLVATLGSGVHSFSNDGHGRFHETTAEAGLMAETGSTSLALADVDGDGDLDLYVANYGAIPIMRTGGSVQIKRVNGELIVTGPHAKRIRVVKGQLEEQGEADVLYLNDGKGRFRAVPWDSEYFVDEAGKPLPAPLDFGLAVQMRDLNDDGVPDIYVCNDFQTPDRFWINDGRGKFHALPRLGLRKESYSAMSADFADVDRDGHLDFMVTEMLSREHTMRLKQILPGPTPSPVPGQIENRPPVMRNVFFRNRGDGTYAELANFSGLAATDWSWQPVFMDVDLDGFEDLLVVNGMSLNILHRDTLDGFRTLGRQPVEQLRTNTLLFPPLPSRNVALRNGGALRFEECSAAWGFDSPRISHGIALADLDNDGDLDVAVNCLNDAPLVYRNATTAPRLLVRLQGKSPNTAGIGATVRVWSGTLPVQSQEIISGGRYLSSDDAVRTFAVAAEPAVTRLEVRWRNGKRSVLDAARPNRVYVIEEPGEASLASLVPKTNGAVAASLFKDVSPLLEHVHHEEAFNDYERQPLLPRQLSQLGPGVGWLDLDGDGQDELIVGTGKGGTLGVFRRTSTGKFQRLPASKEWIAPDDLGGLAAWESSDGRRSILAALAQYEARDTNRASVLSFGIGTTAGNFGMKELNETRGGRSSAGPLAVADMDGDGDLDLFVGGRVVPGAYPAAADSRLYRQASGKLALDPANAALLENMGLVCGAVWSDLTGDGFPELILACEWGPVRVFRNAQGVLRPWDVPVVTSAGPDAALAKPSPLSRLTGWWNGVTTGDFDEDGRLDIVASNWGLNDAYHASDERPLSLYYGNLAERGTMDLIEAYFVPELGEDAPRRDLGVLAPAFPTLAGRYQTHDAFSTVTIRALEQALGVRPRKVSVTTLASMLFLNRGDHFLAIPLENEAQFAPAFALNVADADGDGHEDLFLSQNFFATRPGWPRLDAGRGLWLHGDGWGNLKAMSAQESGIAVYGEQRGAALTDFNQDGRVDLAVSQNGAATRLYENATGKRGLRVRLKGPLGNPGGIGVRVRLHFRDRAGPMRELHAGSGYWSQDTLVPVMGYATDPEKIEVMWPGGKSSIYLVPSGSLEVEIDVAGNLKATSATNR